MEVRAPEKQTNLWGSQIHRGRALRGLFRPASERHGAFVGEAWPLAAKFPPTALPGPRSIPRASGLHQVADAALLQPLAISRLRQGPSTRRSQGEPEQQERLHAAPQIHAAPRPRRRSPGQGAGRPGAPRLGKARAADRACVRPGAELAWLSGCAAGWPPAAPARRCLCCSLPLLRRGSAAKRASASGSGDRGKLFPRGWLLGRGSSCPWPRLPARMLPAHSRGCIL